MNSSAKYTAIRGFTYNTDKIKQKQTKKMFQRLTCSQGALGNKSKVMIAKKKLKDVYMMREETFGRNQAELGEPILLWKLQANYMTLMFQEQEHIALGQMDCRF